MRKNEPSLNVFNRQRARPVDTASLRRFARELGLRLRPDAGFSVVLLRDAAMKAYNRDFGGKDYATDVLSFPADPDESDQALYLGDILISVEAADRQKRGDLLVELKVLTLHGLLHLLGYDHETDRGEMSRMERRMKKEFQLL